MAWSEKDKRRILHALQDGGGTPGKSRPVAGNVGEDSLTEDVKERHNWLGSAAASKPRVSASCEKCQNCTHTSGECLPTPSPAAWTQIAIDFASLPKSPEGYTCVAVAIDYFTGWVEVEPLHKIGARSTACFVHSLLCRHGYPQQIHIGGHSRKFSDKVATHLHELVGVKQHLIRINHIPGNRLFEGNNSGCAVLRALLRLLRKKGGKWPDALPQVLFACRTRLHKATGCTPFFLLYGRQARLPEDSAVDIAERTGSRPDSNTRTASPETVETSCPVSNANGGRTNVKVAVAQTNVNIAQDRRKPDYRKRLNRKDSYAVGEKVLLQNPRPIHNKVKTKKHQTWLGPCFIHKAFANALYAIRMPNGHISKQNVHGSKLCTYATVTSSAPGDHQQGGETETPPPSPAKEDASSDSTAESVVITGEEAGPSLSFVPTTARWRRFHCERLGLGPPPRVRERRKTGTLGVPARTQTVQGDGNCFFRAISQELKGSARHHGKLRAAVVAALSASQTSERFSGYCGSDVGAYLRASRMATDGTWATDVEIMATAALLQTSIVVYTQCGAGGRNRKWIPYKPLQQTGFQSSDEQIYLVNLNAHFERVLQCSAVV